jgi:hypothetical protein
MTGMVIPKEIRQSVIEFLTAWAQIYLETPGPDVEDPGMAPELQESLRAPVVAVEVIPHWPSDPVPAEEATRLLGEVVRDANQQLTVHYMGAIAYMGLLMTDFAREARTVASLQDFLMRRGLELAAGKPPPPYGEDPPTP